MKIPQFILSAILLMFTLPLQAQDTCGDAPAPRLQEGEAARVSFSDGQPLNVRTSASRDAEVAYTLPEGTSFLITDAGTCANDIYWWSIDTASDTRGFIAEGMGEDYFVEPISAEQFAADQTLIERLAAIDSNARVVISTPDGLLFNDPQMTTFLEIPNATLARMLNNEVIYYEGDTRIVVNASGESRTLSGIPVLNDGAPFSGVYSPDGTQLARLYNLTEVEPTFDGCEEAQGCVGRIYSLVVSDINGDNPREIWRTTIGDPYPYLQLDSWRSDGEALFIRRFMWGVASGTYPIEGGGFLEISLEGVEHERSPLTDVSEVITSDGGWIAGDDFTQRQTAVYEDGQIIAAAPYLTDSFISGQPRFSPDNQWLLWSEVVTTNTINAISITYRSLNPVDQTVHDLVTFALENEEYPYSDAWLDDHTAIIYYRQHPLALDVTTGGLAVYVPNAAADTRVLGIIYP